MRAVTFALAVCAALLGFSRQIEAAPALRAGTVNACLVTAQNPTCVLGGAASAGDLIVSCTYIASGNIFQSATTDSINGTYTAIGTDATDANPNHINIYYKENVSAGTPTITTHLNVSTPSYTIVAAYSGIASSSSKVTANKVSSSGSSTAQTGGSVTPTAANQLIVSCIGLSTADTSIAPNNGETERNEDAGHQFQLQDILSPNTSAFTSKWTLGAAKTAGDVTAIFMEPPAASFDSVSFAKVDGSHYRMTYDTANATNAYVETLPAGTADPSAAALIAGTGAHGTATEAATNSADTLDVTVSDGTPYPLYKVCGVAAGGGGNSAVSCTDNILLDPPSGYAWVTLTSIGVGSFAADYNTAFDPDLAANDVLGIPTNVKKDDGSTGEALCIGTVSGGVCTPSTDGSVGYQPSPSNDFTRRRAVNWLLYDYSVGAYMTPDIDAFWFTQNPVCPGQAQDFVFRTAISLVTAPNPGNLDLTGECTHPYGDSLTYSESSGTRPTGLSFAAPVTSGTVADVDENEAGALMTYAATSNVDGSASTFQENLLPIKTWTVAPDCTATPTSDATCVSSLSSLTHGSVTIDDSGGAISHTVARGDVISMSPAAGQEVAPFNTETLVISRGATGAGGRLRLWLRVGL
jgi:hypothetical protein